MEDVKQTVQEVPEGQVTQEVIRQGKLLVELYGVVERLGVRLTHVTRDSEPPPEAEAKDAAQIVSLAQQIAKNNKDVVNCINFLTSLLDRNEI